MPGLQGLQRPAARDARASRPTPTLQLTPDVADIFEEAQSELADGRIEHILKGLYLVASALAVEDADELVQETLTNAISTAQL